MNPEYERLLKLFSLRFIAYCKDNGIVMTVVFREAANRFKIRLTYSMMYNFSRGDCNKPVSLYSLIALCEIVGKPFVYFVSE